MAIGIDLKGIGDIFTGAGTLAKDIRSAVTGDVSPEKKAEIEAKLLEIEATVQQGQMEINKVEAASSSLFVSGWRPMIGWVGAGALGMQYLVSPLISWVARLIWNESIDLPALDVEALWPLLGGILGLGGYRTFEKVKGVSGKH